MKIKSFYVNLALATERAEHIENLLSQRGLDISRFEAVDGKNLTEGDLAKFWVEDPNSMPISLGEFGCFLSHRALWQTIADSTARFGAIFEDDLMFSDDTAQFLDSDDWIPEQCDILKIETTNRATMICRPFFDAPNARKIGKLSARHLGGGGYILSRTAAAKLLQASRQISAPVDYLLFDVERAILKQVPRYQLFPALCIQDIRSPENFLPQGANRSDLDPNRPKRILPPYRKVIREISRPFKDLLVFGKGKTLAALSGSKWGRVPFRK